MQKNVVALMIMTLLVAVSCKKDLNRTEDTPPFVMIDSLPKDLTGSVVMPANLINDNLKIYSEIDNANVSNDNKFSIGTHATLLAKNKINDKPVYFGIPGKNELDYKLDAKETALYFALQGMPFIRRPYYRKSIDKIKQALYELPEVQTLEQYIRNVVDKKGYLDYEEIGPQIGVTVDKVIKELGLLEDRFNAKTTAVWNEKYSAGNGYYRVSNSEPPGWSDKVDKTSNIQTLKREFYNKTSAVVGVRIEDYDFEKGRVPLPFEGNYIGFVEPYYPPNVMTISGNLDNLKLFWETNKNIFLHGWDGFMNDDPVSNSSIFQFSINPSEQKAFVFTNAYYDPMIYAVNVMYWFLDNLDNILESMEIKTDTDKDFLNEYFLWMIKNHPTTLSNYTLWLKNKDYEQIVSDLKEKLLEWFEVQKVIDPRQTFVASKIEDALNNTIEIQAGAMGEIAKYSMSIIKGLDIFTAALNPQLTAAIPIEFSELMLPPYPFKPNPFKVQLDNETEINLTWDIDRDSPKEALSYNVYFGEDIGNLSLVASKIKDKFYKVSDLEKNTRYYWQVEVVNTKGQKSKGAIWVFDNGNSTVPSLVDNNGYEYKVVKINGKWWSAENYRMGDIIWDNNLGYGAYSMTPAGFPDGWRLPTKEEFEELLASLGDNAYKSLTSESGFNAKPFGLITEMVDNRSGGQKSLSGFNDQAVFLTSTKSQSSVAIVTSALLIDFKSKSASINSITTLFISYGLAPGERRYCNFRLVKN